MTRPESRPAGRLELRLFGSPVAHSRSPSLLDGLRLPDGRVVRYEAVDVSGSGLAAAFEALRSGAVHGANVTVPHKRRAAALVDVLEPAAARLDAINVVVADDGGALRGASTDGEGFLESLDRERFVRAGSALILGSGGAARAVEDALRAAGLGRTVVSRAPARVRPVHDGTRVLGWDDGDLARAAADAGLIVQATPLGMAPFADRLPPLPLDAIGPAHAVVDLVYEPWETPFLAAARRRGAEAVNGWPMLVGQAAAALERWAGPGAGERVRERAASLETRDAASG